MICRIAWPLPCLWRQADRGGGSASNGAGSTLDVVVGGKRRLLLTPAVMSLIYQRECKKNMSTGQWTEPDAWAYGGGRE
jgi:hypothetical protein